MNKQTPVSRAQALVLMSNYYKNNKAWLPDAIKDKRETILKLLQEGLESEDAFVQAMASSL